MHRLLQRGFFIFMNVLEKEIEEIVFQSENYLLAERGLDLHNHKMQQVNFGSYGIADMICWNRRDTFEGKMLCFQVVELKKDLIDVNTLMQASKYAKAINENVSKFNLDRTAIDIEIILIGKKIQTNGDFVFLADFIDNLSIYIYEIDLIKGIKFNQLNGWHHNNPNGVSSNLNSFLEYYKNSYRGKS